MANLARRGAPQVAKPAAWHLARLGQQLEENHRVRLTFNRWEEGSERLYILHWELREKVNVIPATSLDDLRIKARAAQMAFDENAECSGPGSFRDLANSFIDDILLMTGAGAA